MTRELSAMSAADRAAYLELLGEAVQRPLAEIWYRPMSFRMLDG